MRVRVSTFVVAVLIATAALAQSQRRLALIIGINDYTAARLPAQGPAAPGRDWRNLDGAVNDTELLSEMLTISYGFARSNIVTLINHQATRAAILQSLGRLAATASRGDIVFFYYAGHGSQQVNSKSDEPDKLDETIVPADSRRGAPDIRDKELRPFFNRILDRGAGLTILLDSCHSGSGARGLPSGARPRSVKRDSRDLADGTDYGPRPEERGALVLSATQDYDSAYEMWDEEERFHGVFSWAWIRSMRDAAAGEPVEETFLRADARMRAERPDQEPVIAGNAAVQRAPFLGARTDRRGDRTVVAVAKIRRDGMIELNGGWANGLSVGSELLERATQTRLRITAIAGVGRSSARVVSGRPPRLGDLLEIVAWAAPTGRPLRIWAPRVAFDIQSSARKFAAAAAKRGIRWVSDPTATPATQVLRHNGQWELVSGHTVGPIGDEAAAIAAISKLPKDTSLFVQLPIATAAMNAISSDDGVEFTDRPERADYLLAGRYVKQRLDYAWVRPFANAGGSRTSSLPLRSDWTATDLRPPLLRLRRIHAWHMLESPPAARSPYHLALRDRRNGAIASQRLTGGQTYELVLRAAAPPTPASGRRFMYVFVIDSFGRSFLLFPVHGSVENGFPLAFPAPAEIPLGASSDIDIVAPFGVDTYFLLTTDEPLANPLVLEWDGIRTRDVRPRTALERLLVLAAEGRRGVSVTPVTWSIERTVFESVPPRTSAKKAR